MLCSKKPCFSIKKMAPGAILLSGALWGSMGIFVRRYDACGLNSLQIVGIRAVGTALLLFLYLLWQDRDKLKIKRKDLWCFLGTGLCSIVFFNYCYFKTIVLTDLSVAAVLLYTAPSMVMVMSAFLFGEKFHWRKGLALLLAFIGCVFVTGIIGSRNTDRSGIRFWLCAVFHLQPLCAGKRIPLPDHFFLYLFTGGCGRFAFCRSD